MDKKAYNNIETRKKLTKQKDYSILAATITKGTFGMTPSEYKDLKD
jgi:hypothetical protein